MTTRRSFLIGAAAAGVAAAGAASWAGFRALTEITPNVRLPGQAAGHQLRDLKALPAPSETRRVGVAICGSGIGGLSCAWRLAKSGRRDAVVVEGPERYGNAAGGAFGTQRFPTGAHYLPLPSMESTHVREMLADFGVIERNPFGLRPTYDERVLVHAPDERLWLGNRWQDGFVPHEGITDAERAEHVRFFAHIDRLRQTTGADGRRIFTVPTALASADPSWRALDALTFRDWLHREGYQAATLHWYADYCCRDDYGATADHVSAWAGLAYFASRGGLAANAEQGTVLTWPEGLDWMAERLFEAAGLKDAGRLLAGSAARIGNTNEGGARVFADVLQADGRVVRLLADHVVSAMPLHVAKHVVRGRTVAAGQPADRRLPARARRHAAGVGQRGLSRHRPRLRGGQSPGHPRRAAGAERVHSLRSAVGHDPEGRTRMAAEGAAASAAGPRAGRPGHRVRHPPARADPPCRPDPAWTRHGDSGAGLSLTPHDCAPARERRTDPLRACGPVRLFRLRGGRVVG
jgi:hypothetical protein